MSDLLGDKFNLYYYEADDMVTVGIFVDSGKYLGDSTKTEIRYFNTLVYYQLILGQKKKVQHKLAMCTLNQ